MFLGEAREGHASARSSLKDSPHTRALGQSTLVERRDEQKWSVYSVFVRFLRIFLGRTVVSRDHQCLVEVVHVCDQLHLKKKEMLKKKKKYCNT